ncbi:tRNA pseudouridine(38-40) synthase TruA [Ectothiorhodospiraceae bacterium 2226]|nr:tRNA pseudouridine(38-40) synthase TruA [Ectothiorhodospiraceae bacterium 2226]
MRLALGIEYDGTGFHGWQTQDGPRTVQATLEAALSKVADAPVTVVAAGRTDAGVHAAAQVVHFDTDARRSERGWTFGANSHLPRNISVTWAREVPVSFHARFSARRRRYRYVIYNRPVRSALWDTRAAWEYRALDAERMHEAAQTLLGAHDFTSFRCSACQAKSPYRTLEALDVARHGPSVVLDVQANAFLHHMVRNLAGVLMAIGMGKQPVEWARAVLEARDRREAGVTAPAQGLYLAGVEYPEEYALPGLSPLPPLW